MAELTEGNVNLLAYVDSRLHGRRFSTLGAITQPGCRPATGPDKYGLWMDVCDQAPVPGIEGGAERHHRAAAVRQSRFQSRELERRGIFQASTTKIAAALSHRHDVRLLPHRLQPAEPAAESRAADLGQSRRRDRQSVLGRGAPVQPAHAVDRFPLARREPAAGRHVGYVAVRDRSHQQPERDQLDLQPRVQAHADRGDGRRQDKCPSITF